jgi:glycosyltransferase involved in cell wall biosynthesis
LNRNSPVKNVVLIGSTQISLNPRLLKEADALAEAGYNVTVIYKYWNSWGQALDQQLLAEKKWNSILVGGTPDFNKLLYWYTRFQHKAAKILVKLMGINKFTSGLAIDRCTWLLRKKANSIRADLYIAHTLPAIPAAVSAAKKFNAACGFDAEDFHRNEVSDDPSNTDVRIKSFMESVYFSKLNYFTAASDEIAIKYQELFKTLKPLTILNTFPINKIPSGDRTDSTLKLFWFSQTVGLSRGLQDVINAMKYIGEQSVEIHILGYLTPDVEEKLNALVDSLKTNPSARVIYHQPIPPQDLPAFSAQFDIGLALEPGFSINNDIALSNKLLMYVNAGLAVIATNTSAQQNFLLKYPAIGSLYKAGDYKTLGELISLYSQDRKKLEDAKKSSRILGSQVLNWENESKKFLSIVEETLSRQPA